jgi:hypothetical protein
MMDKSVPPPKQKTMIRNGVAEQSSSSEFIVHELLNELPISTSAASRCAPLPNGLAIT